MYRQQQRLRQREARGKAEVAGNHRPEAAQSASAGQAGLSPSLRIRLKAYPVTLHLQGGCLRAEEAAVLARLQRGAVYDAWAWVPREGHKG